MCLAVAYPSEKDALLQLKSLVGQWAYCQKVGCAELRETETTPWNGLRLRHIPNRGLGWSIPIPVASA